MPTPNVKQINSTTGPLTRNDLEGHAAVLAVLHGIARTHPTAGGENYRLWRDNHHHPSLDFKKLAGRGERFSVRIGDHYRALGQLVEDGVEWVWIGTHED